MFNSLIIWFKYIDSLLGTVVDFLSKKIQATLGRMAAFVSGNL